MSDERISVVLGVVYNDAKDKALIARRPNDSHLGGLWEFPGGKVREGETAFQALKRELLEEINIDVRDISPSPLIAFDYDYPDKSLRFSVWRIADWAGELRGMEGQEIDWADVSSLSEKDFPEANKGIITACKLPGIYLITPDLDSYPPVFIDKLAEYISAGVSLMQFRSKKSELNAHKGIIREAIKRCDSLGTELIINSTPEFAAELGASGVHLSSERLLQLTARPLGYSFRVGASCHNMRELEHAVKIGADFCVLSQVNKSQSHDDDVNILGWDGFSAMVNKIPIPVYALGGMKLTDLSLARKQGAQGIALIGDVWNRPDSAARIAKTLTHISH